MSTKTDYRLLPSDYAQGVFTRISIMSENRGGMGDNSLTPTININLPLPNQLSFLSGYNWSAESLSLPLQSVINTLPSSSTKTGSKNNEEIKSAIEYLSKIDVENSPAGEQMSNAMQKMGINTLTSLMSPGGNREAALKYYFQHYDNTVYNPNKTLFFNGVDQRTFVMSFDIVPTSALQAKECAEAISLMRIKASPSFVDSNSYFKYPNYFTAQVVVLNKVLVQYKTFAITNIATNLSPNGAMSWHNDGLPVSYILEIQGIESEVPSRESEEQRYFLGYRYK